MKDNHVSDRVQADDNHYCLAVAGVVDNPDCALIVPFSYPVFASPAVFVSLGAAISRHIVAFYCDDDTTA